METKQSLDVEKLRRDFIMLSKKIRGKDLVYLDNSATSLTPEVVIGAMNQYYGEYNANIHRSIHTLGEKATEMYDKAHKKVAKFIDAKEEEIIFTSGTTMSLNILAYSLIKDLEEGDEILISEMEHHSNVVPWQQLAKEKKLKLKFMKVNEKGELNLEGINDKTKIVSVTHVSNVLGTINNVKEIGKKAHEKNAIFIVDAAQSVPHMKVDVKDLNVDFLCFSGHKMLGPTGIGVLYGKKELLEKLNPVFYGGDMISKVEFEDSEWNELPWKFEAGTPNISGGIGLGKAIDYLETIGMDKIKEHVNYLTNYALSQLKEVENVKVYGPEKNRAGVVSFSIKDIHAHDVAAILDREGIAIRAGHMCAMPLVTKVLGEVSVCRASLYFYNTTEEIDKLIDGIEKVKGVFK